MRAGPPRGMRQSIRPRSCMKATAVSCEVSSTRATASSGRPAFTAARRRQRDDGSVGLDGGRRTAQERGVARLQAQTGGVARDVGAVLVDDADHAERHPHPRHPQPVGADPTLGDLAHRVGQRGHLAQTLGHATDPALVQPEAIPRRLGHAGRLGAFEVTAVRLDQRRAIRPRAGRPPGAGRRRARRPATGRPPGRPPDAAPPAAPDPARSFV